MTKAKTGEEEVEAGGHRVDGTVGDEAEGTAREGRVGGRSRNSEGIWRET